MRKNNLILSTIIILVSLSFVFALSYNLAPSTTEPGNTVSLLSFNVTNSSSTGNNLTQVTIVLLGTGSFGNISSVNISDGTNDYSNGSITSSTIFINVSQAQITSETNFTVNFTINSSASWNATFGANITAITNVSNVTYSATPYNSSLVRITDSTDPSVSLSKTSSSTDKITVGYSCSDTFSGVATCVVSSTVGSVSGGVISGLSCGNSYTITLTGTDNEGNTASSAQSFSTNSCGTSSGSSYTPPFYSNTYVITNDQFTTGYTNTLKVKERVKVNVGVEQHYVGVKSVSAGSAVVEVTSDPQEATMSVGGEKNFDVNGDGVMDISVKVNSIEGNNVGLTIQEFSTVSESSENQESSSDTEQESETSDVAESKTNYGWVWIVVIIALIALAWFGLGKKKK